LSITVSPVNGSAPAAATFAARLAVVPAAGPVTVTQADRGARVHRALLPYQTCADVPEADHLRSGLRPFWVAVQAMVRSMADRVGRAFLNASVLAWARAARNRSSCGWIVIDWPSLAVVHLGRSGQLAQAAPKAAVWFWLIGRVTSAGQVTVPLCSSTVKSSTYLVLILKFAMFPQVATLRRCR
jgi:hypothetical protein